MTASRMTIGPEILATIKGVNCEYTSRANSTISTEEVQDWCNNWLYGETWIEVDTANVRQLMEDCELTELQAKQQAAVDAAFSAWMDSHEFTPESLSASPIT